MMSPHSTSPSQLIKREHCQQNMNKFIKELTVSNHDEPRSSCASTVTSNSFYSLMDRSLELIVDFPEVREASYNTLQVSFATDIDVKLVENLSKYKSDLWCSRQDLIDSQYRAALMIKKTKARNMTMAQYAEMNIHDTSTFLGLEKFLSDTAQQEILHQRNAHRQAVLSQHQSQVHLGIYDADALARTSEATSDWSRKRARIIGLRSNHQLGYHGARRR